MNTFFWIVVVKWMLALSFNTYFTLREVRTAYISVAPIQARVPCSRWLKCEAPWGSAPWVHASSIRAWTLGMLGTETVRENIILIVTVRVKNQQEATRTTLCYQVKAYTAPSCAKMKEASGSFCIHIPILCPPQKKSSDQSQHKARHVRSQTCLSGNIYTELP